MRRCMGTDDGKVELRRRKEFFIAGEIVRIIVREIINETFKMTKRK